MKDERLVKTVLWGVFFLWLDLFPFNGFLVWLGGISFTICYLLAVIFYHSSIRAAAICVAAGFAVDAVSGMPVHTIGFAVLYYLSRVFKKIFYLPGSPAHIISFLPVIIVVNYFLYVTTRGGYGQGLFPNIYLLLWSLVDYLWFLIMLTVFKPRGRVEMYKM
ncbi:MAG TPA: hypothetical protein PLN69_01250 [bacterium]|nr:hypothetical protein [bacterium]